MSEQSENLEQIHKNLKAVLPEGVKTLLLTEVDEAERVGIPILETRTQDIPKGKKTTWRVHIKIGKKWYALPVSANGVNKICIWDPRFYAAFYGLDPREIYDLVSIHEVGGGGVVAQPYFLTEDGRLFIGWVKQRRDFMSPDPDEPVLNAVRGFSNYQHLAQAMIELGEETGIENVQLSELPGAPINFNSARVETWGQVTDFDGKLVPEGLKFFAEEIPMSSVIKNPDGETYVIKPELVTGVIDKKEKILSDLIFSPYAEVIKSGDQFSVIGASRILLHLAQQGISVKIL